MRNKRILKVVLIGDGGVGKTSLRNQFVHKRFTNNYKATIGADFIAKDVRLADGTRVTLQIWDTAGQERFASLSVAFYRGADVCVLVYDINNYLTFEHLEGWHGEFLRQSAVSNPHEFPFVIIGNKTDINRRVVSRRQARAFAQEHASATGELRCFETSSWDGTGVEDAFRYIAYVAYKAASQTEQDMSNGDVESIHFKGRSEVSIKDRGRNGTGSGSFCCGV